MHSPDHLIEETKHLKLDGLYPEVRIVLRSMLKNLAMISKELAVRSDAVAGLPAELEARIAELETLTEIMAENSDRIIGLENQVDTMGQGAAVDHAAIAVVQGAQTAASSALASMQTAMTSASAGLASAQANVTSMQASIAALQAALAGKQNYVAPSPAVANLSGAALTENYNVVTTLLGALVSAHNATNIRVNEQTAKINAILAVMRTRAQISS